MLGESEDDLVIQPKGVPESFINKTPRSCDLRVDGGCEPMKCNQYGIHISKKDLIDMIEGRKLLLLVENLGISNVEWNPITQSYLIVLEAEESNYLNSPGCVLPSPSNIEWSIKEIEKKEVGVVKECERCES